MSSQEPNLIILLLHIVHLHQQYHRLVIHYYFFCENHYTTQYHQILGVMYEFHVFLHFHLSLDKESFFLPATRIQAGAKRSRNELSRNSLSPSVEDNIKTSNGFPSNETIPRYKLQYVLEQFSMKEYIVIDISQNLN